MSQPREFGRLVALTDSRAVNPATLREVRIEWRPDGMADLILFWLAGSCETVTFRKEQAEAIFAKLCGEAE